MEERDGMLDGNNDGLSILVRDAYSDGCWLRCSDCKIESVSEGSMDGKP